MQPECAEPGCANTPVGGHAYCWSCRERELDQPGNPPCGSPGCTKGAMPGVGYCPFHYGEVKAAPRPGGRRGYCQGCNTMTFGVVDALCPACQKTKLIDNCNYCGAKCTRYEAARGRCTSCRPIPQPAPAASAPLPIEPGRMARSLLVDLVRSQQSALLEQREEIRSLREYVLELGGTLDT